MLNLDPKHETHVAGIEGRENKSKLELLFGSNFYSRLELCVTNASFLV